MTHTDSLQELRNFFSSYFHEDWALDAEGPGDAVSQAIAENPTADELRTIATQIRQFIDAYGDDADIENALFTRLGCYYQPSVDNLSARAWLEGIRSTLLSAADAADSARKTSS